MAAGLQEIVSRAGCRGPGWALPGHPPAEGGWWIGPPPGIVGVTVALVKLIP